MVARILMDNLFVAARLRATFRNNKVAASHRLGSSARGLLMNQTSKLPHSRLVTA